MRRADYYFEHHLSRFYRILFFFLELQARGIWSDQDDIDEGPIPFDLVPREVQAIIDDDNAYRAYLMNREDNTMCIFDSRGNMIGRMACDSEEDLLSSLLTCVEHCRPSTEVTTTTTTTSTTTTNRPSSTTVEYQESKRGKGKFVKTPGGKVFLFAATSLYF